MFIFDQYSTNFSHDLDEVLNSQKLLKVNREQQDNQVKSKLKCQSLCSYLYVVFHSG